jgi:hypothetical protein
MIIRLTRETAVFTNHGEENEQFYGYSVRKADEAEMKAALKSIPTKEISEHPEAFRALAVSVAEWKIWFGELCDEAIATLDAA